MTVKSPETAAEWENYFQLRWKILREPWGQAVGSEKDELEFSATSFHALATNINGHEMGVARIQLLTDEKAQIRYMAVNNSEQGKGIGSSLITYLEIIAKANNVKMIILQARENAIPFYLTHNYIIKAKSFLLYGQVQHFLMEKIL